jgi:hypothetical protein
MKASSFFGIIITLAIILGVLGAVVPLISIFPMFSDDYVKDLRIRSDVYAMDNAAQAGEIYLQAALRYSYYQACFDNMKNGGYNHTPNQVNGFSLWYDNYDISPTEDDFYTELENRITENMITYSLGDYNFLSNLNEKYNVILPKTYITEIERPSPGYSLYDIETRVKTTSQPLYTIRESETDKLEVGLTPKLERSFRKGCLDVFLMGKELLAEISSKTQTEVDKEVDAWKSMLENAELTQEGSISPSSDKEIADLVFYSITGKTIPEAEKEINETLKEKLNPIMDTQKSDYLIKTSVFGMKTNITWESCSHSESLTDGKTYTKLSCDFTFNITAILRTDVVNTNPDRQMIVSNGTVVSAPLNLAYLVRIETEAPPPEYSGKYSMEIEITSPSLSSTHTMDFDFEKAALGLEDSNLNFIYSSAEINGNKITVKNLMIPEKSGWGGLLNLTGQLGHSIIWGTLTGDVVVGETSHQDVTGKFTAKKL